jgi:hypothetical protein
MFAETIVPAAHWVRDHTPKFLNMFKPKLNFITLHCMYKLVAWRTTPDREQIHT